MNMSMLSSKKLVAIVKELVKEYKKFDLSASDNHVEQRDFFLFLLFWHMHESNETIASRQEVNSKDFKSYSQSLKNIQKNCLPTSALHQTISSMLIKLDDFNKDILPEYITKSTEIINQALKGIDGTDYDTETSMSLYLRLTHRLQEMNPNDEFIFDEEDYLEIPPDFIELMSRLDSSNKRKVESAYFPFETIGEQCVYYAKRDPDALIRIESLIIGPHLMRVLALAGAKNVELSFSSSLSQVASIGENKFDLAFTLLQPQDVNFKEFVNNEEDKKYIPIRGSFVKERLDSKSVPSRYKELGYLQHAYWSLKDNGVAYMVIGKGSLFRESEVNARTVLINKNAIDAIILLPPNLMSFCPVPLILVVMKKSKRTQDILYVNATEGFAADASRNRLTGIEKIAEIVKNREVIDGISAVVSNDKIIANNYSLNPQNYLVDEQFTQESLSQLEAHRQYLISLLSEKKSNIDTLLSKLSKL